VTSNLRTRVAVVITVLCATGLVGAQMLNGGAAVDPPAISRLGFYPGYGSVAKLHALESWLGQDARYVVQFSDADSASAFTSSIWGQTVKAGAFQTEAKSTTFVESIPLTIGLGFGVTNAQRVSALNATLSGKHDAAYRQGAQYIKSAGFGATILRIGWEFDGDWMPWSSTGHEALWASAYRHVAAVFRSVMPNVRLDWNGTRNRLSAQRAAYPGDKYVDIIGLDVYDKGLGVPWSPATKSWVDPGAAFRKVLQALAFQRDFAIAHGKQVSYPEWALVSGGKESPKSAGNDDPTFIQGMYDWMNSLPTSGPGSLAYHAYFNEDKKHDGYHMLSRFPKAQARFRSLFGAVPGGSTAKTSPPKTSPPKTSPPKTSPPTTSPPKTSPPKTSPTTTSTPRISAPRNPRSASSTPGVRATTGAGYSMLGADGKVYAFGGAHNIGNAPGSAVAMAARSNGRGYWITDPAGNVRHFGTAGNYGGRPALHSGEWVSAISATPSGHGYWLFTIRGRAFAYGDARLHGDLSAMSLNGPIIGSVASPTGHGYYMVGSDGGVFGFGDARYRGSMGNTRLNQPIVGLAPTPDGRGYWLVSADGGVFAFHAPFRGSMGNHPLARPVRGLAAYGNGYVMVASDGGAFTFSDREFVGSLGGDPPSAPIVGVAAVRS
jgi:Glycosyl hydrolase family 26